MPHAPSWLVSDAQFRPPIAERRCQQQEILSPSGLQLKQDTTLEFFGPT